MTWDDRYDATWYPIARYSADPLLEHPCEYGNRPIHIVVDLHLALARVRALQPSCVLHERAFPRDRHGQKERIEPSIVEPFSTPASATFT